MYESRIARQQRLEKVAAKLVCGGLLSLILLGNVAKRVWPPGRIDTSAAISHLALGTPLDRVTEEFGQPNSVRKQSHWCGNMPKDRILVYYDDQDRDLRLDLYFCYDGRGLYHAQLFKGGVVSEEIVEQPSGNGFESHY